MASQTLCDWCEQECEPFGADTVHLTNKPNKPNYSNPFAMLSTEPVVSLHLHRACWGKLRLLLTSEHARGASERLIWSGKIGRAYRQLVYRRLGA